MQQTLFEILTDEQARNSEVIEATLDQELSVGAPWFDKILTEPSDLTDGEEGLRCQNNQKNITLPSRM